MALIAALIMLRMGLPLFGGRPFTLANMSIQVAPASKVSSSGLWVFFALLWVLIANWLDSVLPMQV
jgi:hypothetical protein